MLDIHSVAHVSRLYPNITLIDAESQHTPLAHGLCFKRRGYTHHQAWMQLFTCSLLHVVDGWMAGRAPVHYAVEDMAKTRTICGDNMSSTMMWRAPVHYALNHVASTGQSAHKLIKPAFRTGIANGHFTKEIPPLNLSNMSRVLPYTMRWMCRMPISLYGPVLARCRQRHTHLSDTADLQIGPHRSCSPRHTVAFNSTSCICL
jgi:hypothetical protein